MRSPAHRKRWVAVLVVSSGSWLLTATAAAASGKPDLVQKSVSDPPAVVAAGAALRVEDRVRNLGDSAAGRSQTRFFLSTNGKRGPADTRLWGKRPLPRLRPGDQSTGSTPVEVPVTAPTRSLRLLACAGAPEGTRERRVRNNCRASDKRVEVTLPATCREQLARLGVSYARGPQTPGVVDPVTVELPLNGISYFASGEASARATLFMDCTLAISLHEMGAALTSRGITSVEDLGIYEYRCIAGSDPCVLSQHAHATAIDLREFRGRSGQTYNVETGWMIDSDLERTCSAPTVDEEDMLLHQLVCEWDAANLFHVILTPNYNADHRDHFHVDLTPGADYIN